VRFPVSLIAAALATAALVVFRASAQEPPLIRVDTQLVEVDVVVTDANGPVRGLKQDDFTVLDRGKRQRIAAFAIRSAADAHSSSPLPPGTVSNRPVGANPTVLLFDALNTADQSAEGPAPQSFMRLEALKYLRSAQAGDQYAVYTLAKSLKVVEDFTGDLGRVTRAVESVNPEHSFDQAADDLAGELLVNAPDLHDATANSMATNSVKEMQDAAIKNRALITAEALESIARHLRGLPGRKKLIWLSSNFPASRTELRERVGHQLIEHQDFGHEIDHAVQALNDANVAIYPIDPRDPYHAGITAEGIDTMNLFASGTGGKAFYSITDLAGAMATVMLDSQVVYALGFYPENVKLDGSYHSLSVKVARVGVGVRARKGYYASESKSLSEKQRRDSINRVLDNPLDATGIGLSARAEPVRDKPGTWELVITFDLSQVHLEQEGNHWVALMDIFTYLPAKKKANGERTSVKISLSERRLRESLASGYTLRRPLNPESAHAGELRIAVQDRVAGTVGSVRLRAGFTAPQA
jgi:VWFA-related protein